MEQTETTNEETNGKGRVKRRRPANTEGAEAEASSEEESVAAPKKLTEAQKTERRALFDKYWKADEEVDKAKAKFEEAQSKRSDVVKKIHDDFGKGPFKRSNGDILKIVKRGETYFFRGKTKDEEIDEI